MLSPRPHSLRLMVSAACLLLGLTAGCTDSIGARYPVEGQILLDGKPMKGMSGSVMFVPDPSKGNTSAFEPGGPIDAEGRYKLSTNGKPGAPAGWYKVVVTAVPPGTGDREVVKRPALHARYAAEKTTPLSVQVVTNAAPGVYDLKVTRN